MQNQEHRWPLLAAAFSRFGRPVAVVDLETTGGNMLADRVTEVALLRFENGRAERYEWLVNPQMPIPPFVAKLTGICDGMVADAPLFAERAPLLLPLLRGSVLVAHNSRFDYTFLRYEFQRAGIDFAAPALCTVQLSRRLYPQFFKHNLDSIIERSGLVAEGRHRAMSDVLVLADFLEKALAERGGRKFEGQSRSLMNPKMLPEGLPAALADKLYALPDRHGALVWLDKYGKALGVKACEKTFSEIAAALHGRLGFYVRLAADIRFVPAVGSLHSVWLKAQLAAEYGLEQREGQQRYLTVRFRPDENGAVRAHIEPLGCGSGRERPNGLFLHKKAAKRALVSWAAEAGLCPALLDILPKTYAVGMCPAVEAGLCDGSCRTEFGKNRQRERISALAGRLPVADWGRAHEVEITETDGLNGERMTFRCAGGALSLPDGSWYFDEELPALLKAKFKQGGQAVRVLG